LGFSTDSLGLQKMKPELANKFSVEWIKAWNEHDLDKIMTHYAEDFEMSSPAIKKIMNIESGIIKGKNEVRAYWERALKLNPGLHFEIIKSFSGVDSVIIHYKGHRGLSAETFFFNSEGKVKSAHAHYE